MHTDVTHVRTSDFERSKAIRTQSRTPARTTVSANSCKHVGENIPVKAVCASKVVHIVVKHCNDRVQPREFSLQLKKYTFKGKLPKPITLQEKEGDCDSIKMKATQLPGLVNNATTGHKLQGSSVDSLFVQPQLELCHQLALCDAFPCEDESGIILQGKSSAEI
jgi:hypothetical protein